MIDSEPPGDPRFDAAVEAIDAGNWAAARQAYQRVLDESPADTDAAAGLAMVDLYERTDGIDLDSAIAHASPEDIESQLQAADARALQGAWSEAFALLIELVSRTSGDERERVRNRLVELFTLAGDDPSVPAARTALASALF